MTSTLIGAPKESGIVSADRFKEIAFDAVKAEAAKNNVVYDISADYLWTLFIKQDRKCALSGVVLPFSQAGIERIDRTRGYIVGNVRWVHKTVTAMRGQLDDAAFIEWGRRCFLNSYQALPRPDVHEHFLMQAFVVALRSEDTHTKHGAIIVENTTNHQIGSGYNALFRGMPVDEGLLQRPEKFSWMIHAEENAIMNCTKNPLSLHGGARIYVTGTPCNNCLQRLINFGIKQIYVANRQGTTLEDDATRSRQARILAESRADIIRIELSNVWLQRVFFDGGAMACNVQ